MEILILVVTLFVFLITLFGLSKDDFILLRKNISMDQIFNISFLSLFVGLFSARVFFILASFQFAYLNPFLFFALMYFPGLSLVGGVLGALIFMSYYTSYKKISKERLLDFFSLSILSSSTVAFLIRLVLLVIARRSVTLFDLVVPLVLFISCGVFFFMLLPRQRSGDLKDGQIGLYFLVCFSVLLFGGDLISGSHKLLWKMSTDGIVSLVTGVAIALVLFKKEKRTIRFAKIRL